MHVLNSGLCTEKKQFWVTLFSSPANYLIMIAAQRPNFPYDLFQEGDYVGNSPNFLVRKTVRMSDGNGLLILEEVKVFLTYPSPNFYMDALSGTGILVSIRTMEGNINCVVK